MENITMGKRIYELRRRKGLTQDKLAEMLGVTSQAVSKWENDQACPDIALLPKLAQILDVSTDVLLGTEEMPSENEKHEKESNVEVRMEKSFKLSALSFPSFIIIFGIGLLIKYICNLDDFSWWQFILGDALLCLVGLGSMNHKVTPFAVGTILVGAFFAVNSFGVIPEINLKWYLIAAVFLICWGITMIIELGHKKTVIIDGKKKPINSMQLEDGIIAYAVAFSDGEETLSCDVFKGGNVDVKFGDTTLSLAGCKKIESGATLSVDVKFGDATIFVPTNCKVALDKHAAFGDVDVKGVPASDAEYTLNIYADVKFGELSIRYI